MMNLKKESRVHNHLLCFSHGDPPHHQRRTLNNSGAPARDSGANGTCAPQWHGGANAKPAFTACVRKRKRRERRRVGTRRRFADREKWKDETLWGVKGRKKKNQVTVAYSDMSCRYGHEVEGKLLCFFKWFNKLFRKCTHLSLIRQNEIRDSYSLSVK